MKKFLLIFITIAGCQGPIVEDWGFVGGETCKEDGVYVAPPAPNIEMEAAYFMGQQNAIHGDIRIKYDEEKQSWVWIKSCWNNGTPPIFNPEKQTEERFKNAN